MIKTRISAPIENSKVALEICIAHVYRQTAVCGLDQIRLERCWKRLVKRAARPVSARSGASVVVEDSAIVRACRDSSYSSDLTDNADKCAGTVPLRLFDLCPRLTLPFSSAVVTNFLHNTNFVIASC